MDRPRRRRPSPQYLNDRSLTPAADPLHRDGDRPADGARGDGAAALYEPPFSLLHAGGPDALFAGKDNVVDGIFRALQLDELGANAYVVEDFEWVPVGAGATQLVVSATALACVPEGSDQGQQDAVDTQTV
jgi:hypothetical protein